MKLYHYPLISSKSLKYPEQYMPQADSTLYPEQNQQVKSDEYQIADVTKEDWVNAR